MIKMLFSLIVFVVLIASAWRMYEKAGQAGWISIVPILNIMGLLKMIGKPFWWLILYVPPLTPFTHFVVTVMVARRFGKSALFGVGLYFLPMIFMPLIGLGDARYLGPGD
jgi:hypothetical protein